MVGRAIGNGLCVVYRTREVSRGFIALDAGVGADGRGAYSGRIVTGILLDAGSSHGIAAVDVVRVGQTPQEVTVGVDERQNAVDLSSSSLPEYPSAS